MKTRNRKPKIAVIGLKGLPAFGGAATVCENIIEQLKDKYDFTVYSVSSHTDLKTGDYNGYKQIVFKSILNKRLNTLFYYIKSAFHVLFLGNYDLIHLHHRDAAFIILLLKIRYKILITTHGSGDVQPKWGKYEWFFKLNVKYFVKLADIACCVSKNEKRFYEKKYNLEVKYIPNGINELSSFSKTNTDKSYIFFGAGRIIKTKGCEIMLQSLNLLNYKGKIVIAGDLEQSQTYKNEVLELAKELDVKFIGLIKEKSILLKTIEKAKLFIFPSSVEAMSMMLLEGASVKTPIIASDIVENRDIFNEDEVLFFRTNDKVDLAEKIKWALENINIMQTKANNAYEKLIKQYTWKEISRKYSDIFDHLIK